jgi:hypothetical protein
LFERIEAAASLPTGRVVNDPAEDGGDPLLSVVGRRRDSSRRAEPASDVLDTLCDTLTHVDPTMDEGRTSRVWQWPMLRVRSSSAEDWHPDRLERFV